MARAFNGLSKYNRLSLVLKIFDESLHLLLGHISKRGICVEKENTKRREKGGGATPLTRVHCVGLIVGFT